MSITQCEINSNRKLDLTATKYILQESVSFVDDEILETTTLVFAFAHKVELKLTLSQLSNVTASIAQVNMLSTFL